MKVYLLRHGETALNAQKRYQGTLDIPLSENGLAQLVRADFSAEKVYVSPLLRARQTAAALFPDAVQIPVQDLREMEFGAFEGRNYREMEKDAAYRAWVDGGCEGDIPGGERKAAFCRRTCAAFAHLMAQARGEESLVIVAHGGTQMAILERYALPRRDYWSWQAPPGGGFLLDAAQWEKKQTLQLVTSVQYTRST